MYKRILVALIIMSIVCFPVTISSADLSISATGSHSAITIQWDTMKNACFYQVYRTDPNERSLFSSPFFATEWIDSDCKPGETYSYQVTALDSKLNRLHEYSTVSAELNEIKPTLEMPCKKVLAFTINQKRYTIDGDPAEMSTVPIIKGGRSFLVIRYVVEPIMGEIGWDGKTRKITISAMGHNIQMWIGRPTAIVDGVEVPIDPNNDEIAPFIEDGRTLVPLRFPVEALGSGTVDWHSDSKTAVLTFPMGCNQTFKGRVIKTSQNSFDVIDSNSVSKHFEIEGTSPFTEGTCVSVSYENIGEKTIIGRMLRVPCEDTVCKGKWITGEVTSVDQLGVTVMDSSGNITEYTIGESVLAPMVGQCIAGCVDDGELTSLMIDSCQTRIFKGQAVSSQCEDELVMFSCQDRALTVKLPNNVHCGDIEMGECYIITGKANTYNPTVVTAESIIKIPCEDSKNYIMFAQNYCKDGLVPVVDYDNNHYDLEIPPSLACESIRPGDCLDVTGNISEDTLFATNARIVDAPKNGDNYIRGVVSSITPLKLTVPAGGEFKIDKPIYYSGSFSVGMGLDLWGVSTEDTITSVKLEILTDYPASLTARVIGAVCSQRKLFIACNEGKLEIRLPKNISCYDIENGMCVEIVGVFEDDSIFDAALIEVISCEQDCYGDTYRGAITHVDCGEGVVRILADDEITVSLPADLDCSELEIGMCLSVCGLIEDGIVIPQVFTIIECPPPDCIDSDVYGLVSGIQCEKKTIDITTDSGHVTFEMPLTVDCSSFAVGDCVEYCGISGNTLQYLKRIDCSALGEILTGVVSELRDDGYIVSAENDDLLLVTDLECEIGQCVKAVGQLDASRFIAKMSVVIPCSDSSTVQGQLDSLDCWSGIVQIETNEGIVELKTDDDFDCNRFNVGDCVVAKNTENTWTFEKVTCGANITAFIEVVVTGSEDDWISVTALDSGRHHRLRSNESLNIGDLLTINAHQIDSVSFDNATLLDIQTSYTHSEKAVLQLNQFDHVSKTCFFTDNWGNNLVAISPFVDLSGYDKGTTCSLDLTVVDSGITRAGRIINECNILSDDDFEQYQAVGVVFAIDSVDEVILLHTHKGDNIVCSPEDKTVLKSLKIGDCVVARGQLKSDRMWIISADIEVSDCMGGEIGRQFTGVVVGVDAVIGRLQVSDDSGEMMYSIWVESASQLTGLTLGDCVSCSGVLLDRNDESELLGRTIARIDCVAEANKPILIEGNVTQIDKESGMLNIKTNDGMSWKVYLAGSSKIGSIGIDSMVRCSGRLQAKKGVIAKAFVTEFTPSTYYWSVSGEVIATEGDKFVVRDREDRNWEMVAQESPIAGTNILAIGILPPDGFTNLVSVKWIETDGWDEPLSKMSGTVFGLSCGMDNLLVRDRFGGMTSVRLPKTGFCGYFTTGECVNLEGRLLANISGLAKVTNVSQSQEDCSLMEITGRIIARSNVDTVALIQTTSGMRVRLSFDTEAECVKAEVGNLYSVKGRFSPNTPDKMDVDSLQRLSQLDSFSAKGLVVGLTTDGFYLESDSGRTVKIVLPDNRKTWSSLLMERVAVKGSIDLSSQVKAESVEIINDGRIAIEIVGVVNSIGYKHIILQDRYSGKLWRVETDDLAELNNDVYVVGWIHPDKSNLISEARLVQASNEPTTQMLLWGVVESVDCDNNSVYLRLDDSSVYEVHSGYYGQCETFTPGETLQVVGLVQPGEERVICGARILRPGLVGDQKVITGVVAEISCTSRVIKIQEDDKEDIPGSLWTIRLADDVDCNTLAVGDRLKVTGDPIVSEKYLLEDATVVQLTDRIRSVTIKGMLVTYDKKEQMLILKSEGILYQVIPKDISQLEEEILFVGDILMVEATISSNRKTILKDATWEEVHEGGRAYTVLSGHVVSPGCEQMRLYTKGADEYWRVDFATDQPCERLGEGMEISVKGVLDYATDQLLLEAIILDYMKKVNFIAVVDEIDCHLGTAICDVDGMKVTVHLEKSMSQCLVDRFAKGDRVEVIGWQNILYTGSPLYFATFEKFGNEAGLVPVDFKAEVLIDPDCNSADVLVESLHIQWRIRLPDGYNCEDLHQGDWIHIEGGIESWENKTILADSIKKSLAFVYGHVSKIDYREGLVIVSEIQREFTWDVYMEDNGALDYKPGDYLMVTGDSSSRKTIMNGKPTKLEVIHGLVSEIDLGDQALLVEGADYKKYKAHVMTNWMNVSDFELEKGVSVVGLETDRVDDDGRKIYEQCFAWYDKKFDRKACCIAIDSTYDICKHRLSVTY
jgi:hypothetical protein